MNLNLASLIKNFNFLRYSVGIAMMFNGFPLIFFFRDTLGIGPASSTFTAIFFLLALALMVPSNLFLRFYKPNPILFNLGVGFLAISMYYFFFFNPIGKGVTDVGNYVFIFAFLILLLSVPSDVAETLVPVLFLFSLFSNITLVYSLITDPSWTIGMRAAVSFSNEGAQAGGNPHITARNGVICLLSALVLIPRYRSIFGRLFLYFSVLFSLAVVILSLAKSSYLGVGMMLGLYVFYNFKLSRMFSAVGNFFTFKNIMISGLVLVGVNYFLSQYGNVYDSLMNYWSVFEDRIMDVIFTSFGVKLTETADIDASAMGRVSGFSDFLETFYSWDVFLGRGYKSGFLDIPILEAWVNHGIIGFLFFNGFNFFLFIYAVQEIKRNTSPLSTFLAYFFVSLIVLLISGGRPYDIAYWFPYAVMIRFLGIKYFDKFAAPKANRQLVTTPS
ncbi:hypothetical protein [Dyadobacter sp. LHD-138]|uniref:hypothetical protein n=1 Tax=Dyadobacter sp. LHD-138 TaxID=3071413 RepID=UPI0027E03D6A|nr:hypothetical protein [Dyadobacter sp. LHD-138]MDQ6477294.1 hypothetical protein [Dyadobacter sp. LHD-138]